jgi:hypothetical protein
MTKYVSMNSASEDKRYAPDRRVRPTPFLSRYAITGGRRQNVRRNHDKRKHIFVDIYESRLFIAILALLFMNVLDGFLTLLLINGNIIIEANPLMAFCLNYGHLPFFWVKYALMAVSLFIFCIFKNFRFSTIALSGSIVIYATIVFYQLHLVYKNYPVLFYYPAE